MNLIPSRRSIAFTLAACLILLSPGGEAFAAIASVTHFAAIADNPLASAPERRLAVESLASFNSDEARLALEAVGSAIPDVGRADYEIIRAARRALKKQGTELSMPPVSAKLEAELLGQLKREKPDAAIFDWDGTIKPLNGAGDEETTALLGGVVDAGIHTMVLTDRPDVSKSGKSPTILDSLSGVSASVLSRLSVGANRGARILQHDDRGVARVERTEPSWTAAEKDALAEASRRVVEKYGASEFNGKTGDQGDYSHSQFLKIGMTPAEVAAATDEFREILRGRGLNVEVIGRSAYKPTDPPYITVSKIDKSLGVRLFLRNIDRLIRTRDVYRRLPASLHGAAKAILGLLPQRAIAATKTVLVGDHFFQTRNIDSGMVKGAPGALAISVGGLADPDLDNTFVWRTQGPEGTKQIAGALAAKDTESWNKRAVIGSFLQRSFSIAAFVATSIAYPVLAVPIVGAAGYGALLGVGGLVAVATGPIAGRIADRFSMKRAMSINTVLRAIFALDMPVFWALGLLSGPFAPYVLVMGSVANGFLLSSIMVTEQTYNRRLAGAKNLTTINALSMFHGLLMQALLNSPILGIFAGLTLGGLIDAHNLMIPFIASAVVHITVVLPLVWWLMPDIAPLPATLRAIDARLKVAPESEKDVLLKLRVDRVASLERERADAEKKIAAGDPKADALRELVARNEAELSGRKAPAAKGRWKTVLVFLAAVPASIVSHSPLPVTAAMLFGISRTAFFKTLWSEKKLRYSLLLIALGAFLTYPLQSFIVPLAALTLAGTAGKAALVSLVLASFFVGQMLSHASVIKLPEARVPLIGRVPLDGVVRAVAVGMAGALTYSGLVPGSILAALGAMAAAWVLMKLRSRFTDRGSIKFMGVGLSFIGLIWATWGSIPVLNLSVVGIGLFLGAAVAALSGYFQKNARESNMGAFVGIQGSFFSAAISFGYGAFGLLGTLFTPVLPGILGPMTVVYLLAGVVYFLAPRFLAGLPDNSLHPRAPRSEPNPWR
jgi:MFS family permease